MEHILYLNHQLVFSEIGMVKHEAPDLLGCHSDRALKTYSKSTSHYTQHMHILGEHDRKDKDRNEAPVTCHCWHLVAASELINKGKTWRLWV